MFLTRDFYFRVNFFFKNFFVIVFSIFCFGISALDFFYLSALLECFLSVLAESGGCRIILLLLYLILFQKIQKYLLTILHCIFHFAQYLHQICFGVLVRISYRKACIYHSKKIMHFTQQHTLFFHGHNAFALIVRCAFCFMLCHNTIGCTVIYLFE